MVIKHFNNHLKRKTMSKEFNNDGNLQLSRLGQKMGANAFKSFLLAGERNLISGFDRKDTDEARFADFYKGLPDAQQSKLTEYFKSQSRLSLSQRSQLLGELTDLKVTDKLITANTMGVNVLKGSLLNNAIANFRHANAKGMVKKSSGNNCYTKLAFNLDSVKVNEAQDDYTINYLFFKRTYNRSDEITFCSVGIDETGDVSTGTFHVPGSLFEGRTKSFSPAQRLHWFNLTEGENVYPRVYSVTLYAVERDSGGYNDLIRRAANYAKEKVTAELLAAGIMGVGAYVGAAIPPHIAYLIANYVESFIEDLIDWLADLLTNNDDVLGAKTRVATLGSCSGNWRSTGNSKTDWTWRFNGQGGSWDVKLHWLLSN